MKLEENDAFKLQSIIDGAHLGTWEWNVQTGEAVFNDTWAEIIGYTLDELAPVSFLTWETLLHPDDKKASAAMLQRHFSGELPLYSIECRMKHKDGHWIWIQSRGKVVSWTSDGKPLMMFGAHTDIDERKRTEEELANTRLLLEETFEQSPLPMVLVSMPGAVFSIVNPAAREFLGMTNEPSYIGTSLMDFKPSFQDFDRDGNPGSVADLPLSRALAGKKTSNEDRLIVRKDGTSRWELVSATPIFNKNGEVIAGYLAMNNITERKLAEEASAAEKERLAVTLRSIGDGVITTDMQGRIVIMNKVAEELCGWKQDEAQGMPISSVFNIINENTRDPHDNPVERVLASGEITELANHTLLISRDGTERVIADSGAPIKDKDSKTIGVVLVFRDMTEKQKLNETIQRTQKLESLGILAGGIAHDFNNLMGGIFGYIDLANEESDKGKVSLYLQKAMNTIDRARALTAQLLTFAKGGAPIQKVGDLFPFVEETARFALSGANVSCRFDVQPDLWPGNFDKNQIAQVIDNLIINAQQAMPVGGTIELSARNITLAEKEHPSLIKNNYVKISIKDSGIGIQKEFVSKIFDPFFTTKAQGHGLGLATCYSIIKRHEGSIEVESEMGKGSTFHIYLPASADSASSLTDRPVSMHKGIGTFVIMDDEIVMRETIKNMLESFGYSVVCTEDGNEALAFFKSEQIANRKIAGMIFDLTVPSGMGGKAAIGEIRKIDSKIPVFVASGYAEDPVMKTPDAYGFMASICKPFRKSELSEMLNQFIKPKR